MADSNLLIACHCEVHNQLHHVKSNGSKGAPVGAGAIYIDPFACPDRLWSSVAAESVDYVWGENCSVYFQLTNGLQLTKSGVTREIKNDQSSGHSSRNLFQLLDNGYRVLKNKGKIIFGEDGALTENVHSNVALINAHPKIANRFHLAVVPALGYEINLAQTTDRGRWMTRSFLYVFTKIAAGAGAGSRSSRRSSRRSRRKRTLKNRRN